MVTRRGKKPEQTSEELKNSILSVARKHFATHGVAGSSLKDIAAEAQVAGSLLNYHFKDKEGLFRACLEPFARSRTEVISRILVEPQNRDEMKVRLELFIEEMQSSMIANRHMFEIVDREIRAKNPMVFKIFEETMLHSFMAVKNFFKHALEKGLLLDEADPMMLSIILFTSCCDSVRKDEIGKRFLNVSFDDPEFRRKFAQNLSALFLRGVMK